SNHLSTTGRRSGYGATSPPGNNRLSRRLPACFRWAALPALPGSAARGGGKRLLCPAGIAGVARIELRIAGGPAAIYHQRSLGAAGWWGAFEEAGVIFEGAALDARIAENDNRACRPAAFTENSQNSIGRIALEAVLAFVPLLHEQVVADLA